MEMILQSDRAKDIIPLELQRVSAFNTKKAAQFAFDYVKGNLNVRDELAIEYIFNVGSPGPSPHPLCANNPLQDHCSIPAEMNLQWFGIS